MRWEVNRSTGRTSRYERSARAGPGGFKSRPAAPAVSFPGGTDLARRGAADRIVTQRGFRSVPGVPTASLRQIVPGCWALVGIVLLLGGTSGWAGSAEGAPVPGRLSVVGQSPSIVPTLGSAVAYTPSTFWSLDLQTNSSNAIATDPAVRSYLNSTPFSWFRYGEWTEQCNITANVQYGDNGVISGPCAYNLSALRSWCGSVAARCHLVLPLPAENNNSEEDAFIANWIVHVVGIQPQYWSVGNEPSLWKHFGIPWTRWSPSDHSRPTPLAYAVELRSTMRAVRQVDPGARFMGLEAASPANAAWFATVAQLDVGRIAAIGYHSYPVGSPTNETLAQFLSPLRSSSNVTSTYATVRSDLASGCTGCAAIPVFLHEFNAGPGNGASPFGGSYANAVFLGASVVQALEANVTQFTVFNLQSNTTAFGYGLLNRTDAVAPTGTLFSSLLSHLVRGSVHPVSSGVGSAWGVLTENSLRASLLIVNANLTSSVSIPASSFARSGTVGTLLDWNASLANPRSVWGRLPANLTVPPEGMVLAEMPAASVASPPPIGGHLRPAGLGVLPPPAPPTLAIPRSVGLAGLRQVVGSGRGAQRPWH